MGYDHIKKLPIVGGYVYGSKIPCEFKWPLDTVQVEYPAKRGAYLEVILSCVINALGLKPEKNLESRSRQCIKALDTLYKDDKFIAIVIKNAHLLSKKEFQKCKWFMELGNGINPCVVFLGDEAILRHKINQIPKIKQNTQPFIDLLSCSFCGKNQKEVDKLIAGPGVYICDECVFLCAGIMESEEVEEFEGHSDYRQIIKNLKTIKKNNPDTIRLIAAYIQGVADTIETG